jgi:hypothetical protein
MLKDRIGTLGALLRSGLRPHNRRHFVILVVLVLAGIIVCLGAVNPFLSPFLYTMF